MAAQYTDRTIMDFRSRLTGGGSRANLFECNIAFPTAVVLEEGVPLDLRFLIKSAQLPGSTINSIPVAFRGRTLKLAGDRTYENWSITVLNDTNFKLRTAFERWSNYMNRHEDNAGVITPSSYQTDIIVHQLSRGVAVASGNNGTRDTPPDTGTSIKVLRSYKLYGCFPTLVDPIPLSYDSSDSIEEFNVTFEVQWWDSFNDGDGSAKTSIFGTGPTPNAVVTEASLI